MPSHFFLWILMVHTPKRCIEIDETIVWELHHVSTHKYNISSHVRMRASVDQFMLFNDHMWLLKAAFQNIDIFNIIVRSLRRTGKQLKLRFVFLFSIEFKLNNIFSNEPLLIKNRWIECHGVRLVQIESFPMNKRFICGINNSDEIKIALVQGRVLLIFQNKWTTVGHIIA